MEPGHLHAYLSRPIYNGAAHAGQQPANIPETQGLLESDYRFVYLGCKVGALLHNGALL